VDAVIEECLRVVPGATTVRSHSFYEHSHILLALRSRGICADSNLVAFLQPDLPPILHGLGLLRFPIFFEDDVFLRWATPSLDLTPTFEVLFTPGLKILNFHPTLLKMNAPSLEYYEELQALPARGSFAERGTATVLRDLLTRIRESGHSFVAFPDLVEDTRKNVEHLWGRYLYSWGEAPPRSSVIERDSR
jgi:hypothetical protein